MDRKGFLRGLLFLAAAPLVNKLNIGGIGPKSRTLIVGEVGPELILSHGAYARVSTQCLRNIEFLQSYLPASLMFELKANEKRELLSFDGLPNVIDRDWI